MSWLQSDKKCPQCDKSFSWTRRDQIFCSTRCRVASNRRKKEIQESKYMALLLSTRSFLASLDKEQTGRLLRVARLRLDVAKSQLNSAGRFRDCVNDFEVLLWREVVASLEDA